MAGVARSSLDDLSKRELYSLAKEAGIPGRGMMNKAELFGALGGRDAEPPNDPDTGTSARETKAVSVAEASLPANADMRAGSSSSESPVPPQGHGYVERGALIPEHYGDDKLTAMVRDPHWVFCYWELEGGRCQRLMDEHGSEIMATARWELRGHDVWAGRRFGVAVDASKRNWYLKVEPGTRYRFEIPQMHLGSLHGCLRGR